MPIPELGLSLLNTDLKKLTPEAKYVLIQVLHQFGSKLVDQPIKPLAQSMGLTDKVLKQARDRLSSLGYVKMHALGTGEPGRPILGFKIAQAHIGLWQKQSVESPAPIHLQRIQELLFPPQYPKHASSIQLTAGVVTPRRQSGILSASNRLLLATLYYYADKSGVVRGLGLASLSKRVCMTVQQLKLQLDKLTQTGHLWARTPGISGSHLFGKSIGEFYLNVYQGMDGEDLHSVGLILMERISVDLYDKQSWAWRLFHDAQSCLANKKESRKSKSHTTIFQRCDINLDLEKMAPQLKLIRSSFANTPVFTGVFSYPQFHNDLGVPMVTWDNPYNYSWFNLFHGFELEKLFASSPSMYHRLAQTLQYRIHSYASQLLSTHWDTLERYNHEIHQYLIQAISDDLYPPSWRSQSQHPEREHLIADALGLMIYRIASETAFLTRLLIQRAFQSDPEIQPYLAGSTVHLLPVPNLKDPNHRTAILLQFNTPNPVQNRWVGIRNDPDARLPKPVIEDYSSNSSPPFLHRHALMEITGIHLQTNSGIAP